MNGKFSAAQLAALSHPLPDGEGAPDEACTWRTSNEGASGILPCDIDEETLKSFGGAVWHASVCTPLRAYAEPLLAGIGGGNGTAFRLHAMSEDTTQRGGVV
jgi:hypothetical protein